MGNETNKKNVGLVNRRSEFIFNGHLGEAVKLTWKVHQAPKWLR